MGGIYCLPISVEQPALASQPDPANDAWSPLVLTQDNLEEDELAAPPNEKLTTLELVALFQQDLEAQGTELGHGNMTGHNANDDALTGDNVVPGHGDLDIYCWFSLEGKGTLGKVDPILYYLMSLRSWDLPYMCDSIWD